MSVTLYSPLAKVTITGEGDLRRIVLSQQTGPQGPQGPAGSGGGGGGVDPPAGTGVVKVAAGAFVDPATLLVDADVHASAAIAWTKLSKTGAVPGDVGAAAASHAHAESDVTGLVTDLAGKAPSSRAIATTAPLTGGGDLSADRTLGLAVTPANPGGAVALQATTPGTAQTGSLNLSGTVKAGALAGSLTGDVTGNVTGTATPLAHASTHAAASSDPITISESQVTGLTSALAAKEATANKGAAGGYASLDGSTKVPIAQLPTGSTSSTVAIGNDARLSDARTPTAHATSHQDGGSDELALDGSQITTGSVAAARLGAHASRHDAGGADAMAIDAAAGTGSLRTLGTGATQAAAGNDTRLSDARTPTSHASTHNAGGADALAIDAAAATGSLRTLGTSSTSAAAGNDARLSDARAASSIPDGTPALGSVLATAIAAPATPATGKGSVYVDSTSKNIAVKDDAGVVKHGVKTKAAVSNSFVTAIDDDGTVTVAQPAASGITGLAAIAISGSASDLGTGTLPIARIADGAVTLAKLADLAQDQFIGRTTASTGVPQTATITAAARTVLDDTTVGAMVDTLGGAASTGTGGLVRTTSPALVTPSLGAATATTINGTAIPSSDTLVTPTSTATLTNKRFNPRTGTTTSSATPTINTDNVDFYSLTAQAADITSFTTNLSGTPVEGQTLWIAITGTAARAITWGSSFEASTVALPTTTVTTNRLDVGFVWNTVTSKWRCVASA